MKKDASSHVDMSGEITILKTLVNDRVLVIDINYIRPIIATAISISGTFDGYVIVSYFTFDQFSQLSLILQLLNHFHQNYHEVRKDIKAFISLERKNNLRFCLSLSFLMSKLANILVNN